MLINRAYKYELKPNNKQQTYLFQHAGTARFAYNWGLAERIRLYSDTGKSPNAIEQHRTLTKLKKTRFPWMYEVSKCAPQEALRDLDQAYKNFFRRVKNSAKQKGFPKFKKRGAHDSFRLHGTIRIVGHSIQLPRLGRIRLKEKRETYYDGRILSATVSRKADRWFVSICVEQEIENPTPSLGEPVGVDLGIKTLATFSNGFVVDNPRALQSRSRKIRKLQKRLARQKKGSKNWVKTKLRIAKLYWRVSNIRKNVLHKATTHLAKNHPTIIIEDLNVSGMVKNRKLSRAISDVGFGTFRTMLEYKTQWYGSKLIVADRFYPSSKRCSGCGETKDILLSERVYHCPSCGLVLDRDLNAARNLVAISSMETLNACGEDVRHDTVVMQTSMNQELNVIQGSVLDE